MRLLSASALSWKAVAAAQLLLVPAVVLLLLAPRRQARRARKTAMAVDAARRLEAAVQKSVAEAAVGTLHAPRSVDRIVAWDLHEVVFHYDLVEALRFLHHSMRKVHFLRLALCCLHPGIILSLIALSGESEVFERIVIRLGERHALFKPLVPDALRLANMQRPDEGTVQVMEELAKAGVRQFVLSNIGATVYPGLVGANERIFRNMIGHRVSQPEDDYLAKPDLEFYSSFAAEQKLDAAMADGAVVVFVDDKAANVCASYDAGMVGIHFTSPSQLRKDLVRLGFLPQADNA